MAFGQYVIGELLRSSADRKVPKIFSSKLLFIKDESSEIKETWGVNMAKKHSFNSERSRSTVYEIH